MFGAKKHKTINWPQPLSMLLQFGPVMRVRSNLIAYRYFYLMFLCMNH